MDQVTRGLNFCFAYVDDVLIASHSLEEHQHHLRLILDRFKTFGVILNKDKCEFAVSQLTFLGHHISAEGFTPIQQKGHTIQNFPQPKTMKQLRKFLGMINFYRKFIPSCAQILRPLNNLLSVTKSSKKQIQWSAEAESAFSDINPLNPKFCFFTIFCLKYFSLPH